MTIIEYDFIFLMKINVTNIYKLHTFFLINNNNKIIVSSI